MYFACQYTGTIDFQPGAGTYSLTSASGGTVASYPLFRINKSTFAVQWGYNTPFNNGVPSMSIFGDGILVSHGFTGTQDFDPGAGVTNLTNPFASGAVLYLDYNRVFKWAIVASQPASSSYYQNIVADNSSGFYYATDFVTSVIVDPAGSATSLTEGAYGDDGFVSHWNTCSSTLTIAGPTSSCSSTDITYTATPSGFGGTPTYQWYCQGNPLSASGGGSAPLYSSYSGGTSQTLNVNTFGGTYGPVNWYCVASYGGCTATSNTISLNVDGTPSTSATSITATNSTICSGSSTTLSVNGGSLGSGASWHWYTGSCGGTSSGTGSSITVSPTSTTTYYVRAEGTCNTTTCASVTITVNSSSVAPTSVMASVNPVCAGGSTDLSISGGSLGTGASWVWYEGGCGSGTSVGIGSTITVNPTVSTTYYVRAEGTCNTTSCASVTINVNSESTTPSSITASANPVCTGTTVTLSVNGGSLGAGASWEWYSGSCGGTYVGLGTSVSVSPSATTVYYVRAEGACNTTACASVTLTVNTESVAPSSVSASTNPVCEGNPTDLTMSGGTLGAGASWVWYEGGCGSGTSVGTGSTITVNPTVSTTYYVRAEGSCNTTGCASVAITVTSGANAGTDGTIDVCYGSMSFDMFTILGGSPDAGGIWIDGSGNTVSSIFDPSTQTSGVFTYTVTGSGSCGDDSSTVTVTVNPLPTVSFTGLDSTYCGSGGDYIVLTGNQAPNGTFTGTDVTDNTNGTANFLPQNTGTYTITYTYTDGNGCIASDVQSTTIYPAPSVHFVGLDTGYCYGSSSVNLIGNQAPSGSFTGVGITDNMDGTAVFNPDSVGNFPITYTYTDGNGCAGTDVQQVSVYDNPTFGNITVNDVMVCSPPYDGEISVMGTGGNGNYQFAFNGGAYTTDTVFDTLTIGNYPITIMDDYGCSSDTTVAVGGNTGFAINQVYTQDLQCYGDSSGEIIISATDGNQYSIDNGTTSQSDSIFTNLTGGTYYIQVTNTAGCTALDTVTLIEPTQLAYDYEQDSVSCYGYSDGSITLNITGGTPSYSYTWSPSGYTQNDSVYSGLPEGSYAVTITDANGCSIAIPKIEVRQPNALSTQITATDASCYGTSDGTATITATGGTQPYAYAWTGGFTGYQATNLNAGTYIVTITDNNNCQTVDTAVIASPSAIAVSEVMTSPSCIDNNDGSIAVTATGGQSPYIYLWNNRDTDSLAEELTAGTYYLTLTDNNGCETIKTYELPDGTETCLKIPDIFTPNGDGTNDTWIIEGIDLYPDATVEIYNRWGDLIFKSTGYTEPWDGTWHGKELPISSFIYIINLNNGADPIQGIVTIKR